MNYRLRLLSPLRRYGVPAALNGSMKDSLLSIGVSDLFRNRDVLEPDAPFFNQSIRDEKARAFKVTPIFISRLSLLYVRFPNKLPHNLGRFLNFLVKHKMLEHHNNLFNAPQIANIAHNLALSNLFDPETLEMLGKNAIRHIDHFNINQLIYLSNALARSISGKSSSYLLQQVLQNLDKSMDQVNIELIMLLLPAIEKYSLSSNSLQSLQRYINENHKRFSVENLSEFLIVFLKFTRYSKFTDTLRGYIRERSDEIGTEAFSTLIKDPTLPEWISMEEACKRCSLLLSFFNPQLSSVLRLCSVLDKFPSVWIALNFHASIPLRVVIGNFLLRQIKDSPELDKVLKIFNHSPCLKALFINDQDNLLWSELLGKIVTRVKTSRVPENVEMFRKMAEEFPTHVKYLDAFCLALAKESHTFSILDCIELFVTCHALPSTCVNRDRFKSKLLSDIVKSMNTLEPTPANVSKLITVERLLFAFLSKSHEPFVVKLAEYADLRLSRPGLKEHAVHISSLARKSMCEVPNLTHLMEYHLNMSDE